MRRQFLMASAGALALTGSAALAADLPVSPPPPPPVPAFTWTGIYLGGQVGYAWISGNLNFTGFDSFTGSPFNTSVINSPNGLIGGAHVGYNYQINQWVLGLEGTVDGSSLNNTVVANFPIAFGGSSLSASSNSNVQGSIRGRIGIAWDRILIYGTGGVAFGGFDISYSLSGNNTANGGINAGNAFFGSNSFSNTRVGWTAGGGIDYAVTNNWSVFIEYRYTSFGAISNSGLAAAVLATTPGVTGSVLNANRTLNQNQVQVGFSYKFDTYAPAPLVAKY